MYLYLQLKIWRAAHRLSPLLVVFFLGGSDHEPRLEIFFFMYLALVVPDDTVVGLAADL